MKRRYRTWYIWISLSIFLAALVAWSYLPQTFDNLTGVCWQLSVDPVHSIAIDDQSVNDPAQTAQEIAALYSPYLYKKIPLGSSYFEKEFPEGLRTRNIFITLEQPLMTKRILFLYPLGDKLMIGTQIYQILPPGANLGLPLDGPTLDDLEQNLWLL